MSVKYPTTNDEWDAHNRAANEEHEHLHGPNSHNCPGEAPCYGDPECKFAPCSGCGAPNRECVCDVLYERWKDERYVYD